MRYTHRDRVTATLSHKEADRIPFDLGGTFWSSVHIVPYQALKSHYGINDEDSIILKNGQIAGIHEIHPVINSYPPDTRWRRLAHGIGRPSFATKGGNSHVCCQSH